MTKSPHFAVTAEIFRISDTEITLEFIFAGEIWDVNWGVPNFPERTNELWKTTCLELFLSENLDEEKPYIEINVAPDGRWNVYALDFYRAPLKELPGATITTYLSHSNRTEKRWVIHIKGLPSTTLWNASVCCVVEHKDQSQSYWSIKHCRSDADFHARESFVATV